MAFIVIPDGLPSISVVNIANASASMVRSVHLTIKVFPLYGNNAPFNLGDRLLAIQAFPLLLLSSISPNQVSL